MKRRNAQTQKHRNAEKDSEAHVICGRGVESNSKAVMVLRRRLGFGKARPQAPFGAFDQRNS